MTDPTSTAPSEEELRQYLESLRDAQPVEVIVQSFGILATAGEVKLGRPDARIMIDAMAALIDATADRLPDTIVTRMRESVSQLQMAQIKAEREGGAPDEAAQQAGAPQPPSGAEQAATPPPTEPSRPAGGSQQESMTSRLWIPGRDDR